MFNLSYDKKFTCDMGQLIPVMCDEVIPGDVFKISNQAVVRFQPLVAPVMHEVHMFVHYFFVPYRLLWDDWEAFITGGKDGDYTGEPPQMLSGSKTGSSDNKAVLNTLWDYFGFPLLKDTPQDLSVSAFPWNAYNFIWNEYYRDENLDDEVALDNNQVLRRRWRKDYFTSALPFQQRGVSPAFAVGGTGSLTFPNPVNVRIPVGFADYVSGNSNIDNGATKFFSAATPYGYSPSGTTRPITPSTQIDVAASPYNHTVYAQLTKTNTQPNPTAGGSWVGGQSLYEYLQSGSIDFSGSTGFNIADLRLAFQVQKFMERNARAGVRYTEFLRAHFGVAPTDSRLDRPEYIGGSRSPIIFSEVLQTSSTDSTSPQANMAGRGISADVSYIGKYRVQEFGLIMGIMSVMPKATYQQGVNRQWLRKTRYDFPFPEFVNLSEQAIENQELYAQGSSDDTGIFGFQGRYNELRFKPSMVCSEMRDIFDSWHFGRKFNGLPQLNSSFIECNPDKRPFAVQDVPGLLINFGNNIKALRPIPYTAEPGLIDHN